MALTILIIRIVKAIRTVMSIAIECKQFTFHELCSAHASSALYRVYFNHKLKSGDNIFEPGNYMKLFKDTCRALTNRVATYYNCDM